LQKWLRWCAIRNDETGEIANQQAAGTPRTRAAAAVPIDWITSRIFPLRARGVNVRT
jgi:hypothetical protein